MFPPAPGRLSTTTAWPSDSESFCPIIRASVSVMDPAPNATTNEIGFCFGHSWAEAAETPIRSASPSSLITAIGVE